MPRQPTAELTTVRERPPQSQPDITPAATTAEWSEWLARQLAPLHSALGELLAIERERFERKASALELKIAQLTGAVDILRGAAPPPPAKLSSIQVWSSDLIYRERELVTFAGSTYQARRDTARAPGTNDDWVCVAASGSSLNIRGTYTRDEEYKYLDIVIINGSSFVALKDNPGVCPDSGNWHLLASRGSRGQRGLDGERGPRGEKGDKGTPGTDALTIVSWMLDRSRYRAIPMMSNGKPGPELELRGLFEQFQLETKG